ncbi:Hsp20/alpha crystallin family protein [Halopiger thermotolerans]
MSDHPPTDDRDESDDERPDDDRTIGDDHWLSSLLSALESLEDGRMSRSGRRRGDRAVFDYDVSIRTGDGLSPGGSRRDRSPAGGGERERKRRGDDDGRSRKRRIRSAGPSSDHTVTTRRYDDELLVTADVAGADPADVTVGFDDSTLVIAVEGSDLDRVDVPWDETASEATLKNGVLTVEIRPETERTERKEDER